MKTIRNIILFIALGAAAVLGYGAWQKKQASDVAMIGAAAHIEQVIKEGGNDVDLTAFPDLMLLPANLTDVAGLAVIDISGTRISDLGPLSAQENLLQVYARDTWVSDLTPLAGLPRLGNLYLSQSWVSDLSPLVEFPSLRFLELSQTQLDTLEPLIRVPTLYNVILSNAYALDGSRQYYTTLKETVPIVSDANAFMQNYQPGSSQRALALIGRLRERYMPF